MNDLAQPVTKAILCACDQPSTDKKKLKHALCMLCICFILCDGCDGNLLQKTFGKLHSCSYQFLNNSFKHT
ncbi:hypothetical protein T09_6436 [Trichinella sp. T9]|uniref:Uncharacterized protein n=1 Tax=Trichinella murrelli TaxID=144512 RepID=A0A0V0TBB6_9BILA|nr:hypothetical protein T05_5307 [Trichinella murrelli]KRX59374.1 hypothetical protein T09_6436 [Trichinella sp. T9]